VRHRSEIDVSTLPEFAFGPRMTMWWGTMAFCVLEGTGFVLAIGGYLFLAFLNPDWPLSAPPPDLLPATLFTALLLASILPNRLVAKNAKRQDIGKVRVWLVVMIAIGLALIAIRMVEFGHLHTKWDLNAYGSFVWLLLGLHATHLITDVVDTAVAGVLMFTRHGEGKRFADLEDNAVYWNFVVVSWLPLYFVLYWVPRL
jgi:cytochrome c oxidase subunit 3